MAALVLGGLSLIWVSPAEAGTAAETATAMVPTWSTLSPPQSPPGLRYASEAYDADDQTVVLFGGVETNGSVSGATWTWNGTTWAQAAPQVSGPEPRQGAAMAYSPILHQLILFGGQGGDGSLLNDTWAWNGQSWFLEPTAQPSSAPSAREGASFAADSNGELVLFGGTGASGTASSSANAASLGSSSTTEPAAVPIGDPSATAEPTTTTPVAAGTEAAGTGAAGTEAASSPATNSLAAAAVAAVPTTLGDTWEWNGTAWSQPDQNNSPAARTNASLTWDPSLNETVLFGGSSIALGGGSAAPLDDTWAWTARGWSELDPTTTPSARYDALSTTAGVLSPAMVAGGVGPSGVNSDIWSFEGSTWSPLPTQGNLVTRSGAAAAWDDSAGQLVVFGGAGASSNTLADTVVLTASAPVTVTPTTGSTPITSPPSTSTKSGASSTTPAPTTSPTSGGSITTAGGTLAPGTTTSAGSTTLPASSSSVKDSTTDPTTTTTSPPAPTTVGSRVTSPGSETTPETESRPTTTSPPPATSPTPGTLVAPVQTVHTGSLVTVLGSGFRPGAVITITFHSKPYTVGRAVAGPNGTFSATVTVPETASLGEHHLEATGMSPNGNLDVLLTPLKVVPLSSPSPGGSNHTTLIMVGVAVFVPIGTWVFLSLRSRRHPTRAR